MNFLSKYKPAKNKIAPLNNQDRFALVRVDYNVPLKNNRIQDSRRIVASYETIDHLLGINLTPILIAHLGDPKASLRSIAKFLSKRYKTVFIEGDIFEPKTQKKISSVKIGSIVLLENIRRYPGEEKNDKSLAQVLASLGSLYINDAFSVSHRKHASIVSLPKLLPHLAGFQLEREVKALQNILESTKHPFVFILGGAKFATKIPLISKFLDRADQIIIGGAILNNFYKAAGFEVGQSVVENGYDRQIKKLLKNPKLLLPIDLEVTRHNKKLITSPEEVVPDDIIVDLGPKSLDLIKTVIQKAKVVVWNGPVGWYEKGFVRGTVDLAKIIVNSKALSLIGGGDTGATIEKIIDKNHNKKVFISTAGGAAIDFLVQGTLPGLKVLQ